MFTEGVQLEMFKYALKKSDAVKFMFSYTLHLKIESTMTCALICLLIYPCFPIDHPQECKIRM